jgi:hypothetical protein
LPGCGHAERALQASWWQEHGAAHPGGPRAQQAGKLETRALFAGSQGGTVTRAGGNTCGPLSARLDLKAPAVPRSSSVRTREYLTTAEIERLMAAARKSSRYSHRDATMILIGYRHGLRASELCMFQCPLGPIPALKFWHGDPRRAQELFFGLVAMSRFQSRASYRRPFAFVTIFQSNTILVMPGSGGFFAGLSSSLGSAAGDPAAASQPCQKRSPLSTGMWMISRRC